MHTPRTDCASLHWNPDYDSEPVPADHARALEIELMTSLALLREWSRGPVAEDLANTRHVVGSSAEKMFIKRMSIKSRASLQMSRALDNELDVDLDGTAQCGRETATGTGQTVTP